MIASEGLNIGTALAHLQNLSREFETLEAASIKARTELDCLTRFLEQATLENDECKSSSAETCGKALASLEMTRADGAIANRTAELMTAAPAEAVTCNSFDDQPAEAEPDNATVPGEDLEAAFYHTVADLFASNQPEEGDKQIMAEVDALATGLDGSANPDEATDAAASSLTTDPVSDVLDEEPLFDLFAGQHETTVQDEPTDMAILEVNESSLMEETDHQLDEVSEIKQPEPDRGETAEIDHDPQLFGFQSTCLSNATDCKSDDAVSILEAEEIDKATAATETSQPEPTGEHYDFDDIASLFDTPDDELNLAADTLDFVDETVPEHALPEGAETAEIDLPSSASDVEQFSIDECCASDDAHPDRAEEDIVSASDEHQSLEPMQSEPDAPIAASSADPEVNDEGSTSLVREDETTDEQEPVECFSAMHQPIAFEEPTVEAIVIATEQTLAEPNEPDQGEVDATDGASTAIEVATVEPLTDSSEANRDVASERETFEPTEEVSTPGDSEPTAADEAAPEASVQAVTDKDDTPASTSEQTEIVTLPIADESSSQPARGRGRATTIAGLGAIAATLAIALHPPIADELLSLPWQDMLHMNEILDKLSELKRFFAFA